MEVYIDDMLVKFKTSRGHADDLAEAFVIIQKYGKKLNPKKCSFGVASGKFLGFIVSYRGIEANLDKIKALIDMPLPRKHKYIQSLMGRIAALSRFVSKSTNKCILFFNILFESQRFEWSAECKEAFQKLKEHLYQAPILAKPMDGEPLYLYLVVSEHAISAALVREEGKAQLLVYYVSKRLLGAESRISIKGQALDDFIMECTGITEDDDPVDPVAPLWKVFVDRTSNKNEVGAEIILISPQGHQLQSALHFQFDASNNEVEHEAMFAGLRLAREVGAASLKVYSNSQFFASQISGEYQMKGEKMVAYVTQGWELLHSFKKHSIRQIPRERNVFADTLAKLVTDAEAEIFGLISINHLLAPSIQAPMINAIDYSTTWMGPIIHYLTTRGLPADKVAARKLQYQDPRYVMVEGKLYCIGLSMPYLQCVSRNEMSAIMHDVHEVSAEIKQPDSACRRKSYGMDISGQR
ncbi:uncharacterized protein LOC133792214 [Humulus lupulus]|uniref:uncharacterized protein LOC133792214 n=1 Tax=Humulus lupulus TaxID=3486 RepID=UPI002B412FEC|nr:uncharacterized protein LOC133792214 [Humulus lupulus]